MPGICLAKSSENSSWTLEICTPALSRTRPCSILILAAAGLAIPGRALKFAGRQIGVGASYGSLDSLKLRADAIAQRAEAELGGGLFIFNIAGKCHGVREMNRY